MKEFVLTYLKKALKFESFKRHSLGIKAIYVLIMLLTLVTSRSLFGKSIITGVLYILICVISFLIVGFIIYAFVEGPAQLIYKDVILLTNHVSTFFKDDFYKFQDYIYDSKIENIKEKIKIDELPSIEILKIWKYRLEERKLVYQVMLPVLGLMILSSMKFVGTDPQLSKYVVDLKSYFTTVLGNDYFQSFKSMIAVVKYPYLLLVYFTTLEEVGRAVHKIDLLIFFKESYASANNVFPTQQENGGIVAS